MRVPHKKRLGLISRENGSKQDIKNQANPDSSNIISIIKVHQGAKHTFKRVPIMKKPAELEKGMQGRPWGKDDGMYFDMEFKYHSFHTNNCIVPMDIIFIRNGVVVSYYANVQPNTIGIDGLGDSVLELPANSVFKHKITYGTKIKIEQFKQ